MGQTLVDGTAPRSQQQPQPAGPISAALTHESLVLEHLNLADSFARRYAGRGIDTDDLRQVARCGLVEAARRYDPARGPFAAFAAPTISGGLKRYFRDHGWSIRPPRECQELSMDITAQWSDIAQDLGREPTTDDLATALRRSPQDIQLAQQARSGYRTANLAYDDHPAASRLEPGYGPVEARLVIEHALADLDPADRLLLHERFWLNRTQSEIATQLGVSQMQVSRLLVQVLARLGGAVGDIHDVPTSPTAAPATAGESSVASIGHQPRRPPGGPRPEATRAPSAQRAARNPTMHRPPDLPSWRAFSRRLGPA